jgi:hypothetical protein
VRDDLKSFDLEWLRNMEDLLRLAGERGIAAQINVFDTWGKRKADADHSRRTPHPGDLVLEPWNPDTYRDETEWYLRYVIARFAAFPNVMWELGNEVGHEGVDFTPAARAYSKIIRGHDPYGLPIGMSEHREALEAGPETLDIDLTHCCYKSDSPTWAADDLSRSPWTKATLFNELPYKDEDADNPRWAKWFRHLYWETFVLGGAGASELSWMDVDHGRNAVSEYHGRLAALLRELGDYGAVEPAQGLVSAAPRRQWAAKVGGGSFVVYLLGDEQGTVELKLPAGRWWAFWCDPKTGDRTQPVPVSGRAELAMPPIAEDVVLVVEARPAG